MMSGGKPAFPTMSQSELSLDSLLERHSQKFDEANRFSSWLGGGISTPAGLPRRGPV